MTGDRALNFAEAVEASCNIWFAETGVRTGGDVLADWAARMGFGAALPFDLETGASQVTNGEGQQPGGFGDRVELANAAYGQGQTLVTPLQMAMVAATIANDGTLLRPHLVRSATGKAGTTTINPEVMEQVVAPGRRVGDRLGDAPRGERRHRADLHRRRGAPERRGRRQVRDGRARPGDARPTRGSSASRRTTSPQVAIAVLVENSGGGSVKASPIAGDVLRAWRAWVNR